MKKLFISLTSVLALFFLGFVAAAQTPIETISIGDKAPFSSYSMMNLDGSRVSIENVKGANGALVIFTCNTCPFVVGRGEETEGWEGRYNEVIALAASNGIGTMLVNSNSAKRGGDDSLLEMKKHARDANFNVPYVVDEGSKLANGFGARTTPHIFLFDSNLELVYRGSIDDSVNSAAEVKEHYLEDAINRLAAGKKIKKNVTKAIGCSIKRH